MTQSGALAHCLLLDELGRRVDIKLLPVPANLASGAGYMEMTAEKVNEWCDNVDSYVADEEEVPHATANRTALVLKVWQQALGKFTDMFLACACAS